jgi:cytochrome oxidase Cu insertion factor (SCO1/SenC/PrrC family)
MKTHTVGAALALVVLMAACGANEDTSAGGESSPISVGAVAPPFTLPSAEGGTVSSSDFAGKPVLLYFSMGPG